MLNNLVGNAIKFTEQGHITVGLALQPHKPGLIHGWVQDTGVGVAPEKQETIFEAFTQADNSITRHYGGTGLGLTISSNLVHLMGGQIWLESTLGQGSTFHFTVQLVSVVDRAPEPVAPAPLSAPEAASADALNILLVEDHPVNQLLATKLIERAGHRVTLAQDGQQGLDAVMRQIFDLVLMDVQMPVMNGLESTQHIRAFELASQRVRVPIVAMTANAMPSDQFACLEAGMDGFLSKPFKADDLRQWLEQVASSGKISPSVVAPAS